ncbi:response regulator [Paenibacillus sp. HB172176]|uniref:response regulator transcription factor n=1 Tax=Paenibacillus sp. HB172176 TaxID=2493690 RepID=UPI001439F2FA|nr:response regulator [Paenibacillus sp. HB172176]
MKEYTLLIADDEKIIREGLVRSLDWAGLGFAVVGVAKDGEQALARFRALEPDVVLLDIKMPGMSGLELLTTIKRERPDTEVVLLSGFDEFSYAKEGLKQGAFDYILKIDMLTELEPAMSRLRSLLERRRKDNERYGRLLEYKSNYEFAELLRGRDPTLPEPGAKERMYGFASVRFDDPARMNGCRAVPGHTDLRYVAGAGRESLHFIFIEEAEDADGTAFLGQVCIAMETMAEAMRGGEPGTRFYVGISGVKASAADIPEGCREALRTIDYLYFRGEPGRCLHYGEWNGRQQGEYAMISRIGWINWVYAGDEAHLTEWVKRVFADAYGSKDISVADMQAFALELFLQFDKALKDETSGGGRSTEESERLGSIDSLIDLEQAVLDAVTRRCRLLHERVREAKYKSIAAVKEYVDEMFAANLRLEEVALRFHFSPGYLSSKFKEYTGKSFSNYLIVKRIEIACELLVGTDKKVYEIANQVGYTDERHFSKLFTKHRKQGPREYRASRTSK